MAGEGETPTGSLGSYSLVVCLFGGTNTTPAWDWFNALISTLASVFLAVAVGIILFRIQSSLADREEEHEMEQLLHSELVRILDKLQVDLPGEKEPYYPPKGAAPGIKLKPELHETNFKFNYFDTRFLERAENGMRPSTDNAQTRKLVGQLHEYNQQMAHLRFLSVNATAQQEGESRYREQARVVLLLEKRVIKQTREVIRLQRARDKRRESGVTLG